MLNTYIKNRGITQTIIHDNKHNHFNQTNWDADYDGNIANLSVKTNTDGKHNQFHISLDNEDLANILNIPSINIPIDKRLKNDFQELYYQDNTDPYIIELPTPKLKPRKPRTIQELIDINKQISSPKSSEELIIPLTIDQKTIDKYTLTPQRRHKHHKSHITHKVYKKHKSNSKSKSKSRSNSRSSKRRAKTIIASL